MARKDRPIRVAEQIRKELSEILQSGEIHDPRLSEAMATITEVRVTQDLQVARVFVSVFTDDAELQQRVFKGFQEAASEFRRALGSRMRLRMTPDIRVQLDESLAYGAKIESILKEIKVDS